MTKSQWLSQIPRSNVLTLEDVMRAIDVVLSEAEAVEDAEAWRRPQLLRAVEAVENLERGVDQNLARGTDRFSALAMANLRRVLVDRGYALFDELDAAERGLGSDDPLVWTPGAVKAELDRIRGVLDTVNAEVSAATADKKISGQEFDLWRSGVYAPAHDFVDHASTFWGSNVVAARQHEQAAGKWRDFVKARGGQLVGPPDLVKKPPGLDWQIPLILAAAALLVFGLKW
jgi:hypothetical protein